MKRPANAAHLSTENPRPFKTTRTLNLTEYFSDAQFEVPWLEIPEVVKDSREDADDEPGWIIGTVSMMWPNVRDPKIMIQDSLEKQLEIKLTKSSAKLLDLGFKDTIKISLQHAQVESRRGASSSSKLPFLLSFPGNIAVMYVLKHGNSDLDGTVIDTLKREDQLQEDWYGTPAPPSVNGDMDVDLEVLRSQAASPASGPTRALSDAPSSPLDGSSPTSPVPKLSRTNCLTSPSTPAPITPSPNEASQVREASSPLPPRPERVADGVFLSETIPPDFHEEDRRPTSKRAEDAQQNVKGRQPLNGTDLNQKPNGVESTRHPAAKKEKKKKSKKSRYKEGNQKPASPAPPPPPQRNPALDMEPGLKTPMSIYPDLASVRVGWHSVIGVVVTDFQPQVGKGGNPFVTLELVDPSNISDRPLKVTCFTNKHDIFLPPARKNHIVLVRGIKVSEWRGNLNGAVYADRMKWVAFDPSTGRFYHAELGGISKSDADLGPNFDPFYMPVDAEIDYFVKLGQWWRAYTEDDQRPVVVCQPSTPREHKLIGEMDSNVFFDATVEIVRNDYNRDVQQYCLLISDYSPHPQLHSAGYMGQYAIQCLTDRLPKEDLSAMDAGTYWSVKNARLKYGRIGTLECDFYDVKLKQLSEESVSVNSRLAELLKRKQDYLTMCPQEDPSKTPDSGLTIVSALKEHGCYDIIAELAYSCNDVDKCTDLYVTDYSRNPTPSFIPDRVYKKISDRPIFVIGVFGDRHIVRDLDPDSTYLFKDVKVVRNEFGKIKGKINYADKNIIKVSKRSTQESVISALEALEQRKDRLYASQPIPTTGNDTSSSLRHRHVDQKTTTGGIRAVRASGKCPNKFRIRARIVDYHPFELFDFSAQRCKKCKKEISIKLRACVDCDDVSRSLSEWYFRFFLRLKDENGDHLVISVCDEAKDFLGGLNPSDLRADAATLKKLTDRLKKICKPVIDYHEGVEEQPGLESPLLDICIKSWPITLEEVPKRAYAVTGCEIVV